MERTIKYISILLVLSIPVLLFSEDLDFYFSEMFFNGDFYLQENTFIEALDKYLEYSIILIFLGNIVLWALTKINVLKILDNKKTIFLGISMIGWCTALPYSFKYFFHRARPFQSDLYFGNCAYTQAFERSTCNIGDSFISGHTSFAMFLMAVTLILPEKIRTKSLIYAVLFVILAGLSRIMGGYHYFTDVYFAIVLVGFGILITYKIIFTNQENNIK